MRHRAIATLVLLQLVGGSSSVGAGVIIGAAVDFGTAHSTHMKPTEDSMSKLRVHNFAISLDGYGAGPRQGREYPLGVGGEELHGWYVGTRAFREMHGKTGGTTGPDNDFAKRFGEGIGAYIMGRNMFGPVRGPWPDDQWRGWWGENPPYHAPVFVLTNHAREPITMKGGTVFHFFTGGIEEALRRAREAAGRLDIQVGGGRPRCASISRRGSSTRCMSRSRRSCSAVVRRSLRGWTCRRWAMRAPSMWRRRPRRTS